MKKNENNYKYNYNNKMISETKITDLLYSYSKYRHREITTIDIIKDEYKIIDNICHQYTFDKIIEICHNKFKDPTDDDVPINIDIVSLEEYKREKKDYEKYFKVKLNISDKDYIYALPLAFMHMRNIFKVYNKINELIPNFLNKSVYDALCVFKSEYLIWDDKIDKGIIVRTEYKNRYGEVYNKTYEEIDGMYDLVYGLVSSSSESELESDD